MPFKVIAQTFSAEDLRQYIVSVRTQKIIQLIRTLKCLIITALEPVLTVQTVAGCCGTEDATVTSEAFESA